MLLLLLLILMLYLHRFHIFYHFSVLHVIFVLLVKVGVLGTALNKYFVQVRLKLIDTSISLFYICRQLRPLTVISQSNL